MNNPVLCIKIGGRALADSTKVAALAEEIAVLEYSYRCIIIHGGGSEVTRVSERFGLKPQFEDGVRLTTREEMHVVDMVLAGSVNTGLVRAIGHRAVGLSGCDGALFTGNPVSTDSHTGKVARTNTELLETLTKEQWIPVISSVSVDEEGVPLNINADDAALAIAEGISAQYLIFISDIPGILSNGEVVPVMTPDEAETAIDKGIISGGMIPKVRASAQALDAGVGTIAIGSFEEAGDLAHFLRGTRGTSIVQEKRHQ